VSYYYARDLAQRETLKVLPYAASREVRLEPRAEADDHGGESAATYFAQRVLISL